MSTRVQGSRASTIGPVLLFAGLTALLIGGPAAATVNQVARWMLHAPADPETSAIVAIGPLAARFLWTTIYAIGIGVLATILAWPAGWFLRTGRPGWVVLVAAPILLPSYAAYWGWGLLRAPNTMLGDLIASGPPDVGVSAGRVIATLGMALWAWPVAALVIGSGASRIGNDVLSAARVDTPSTFQRRLLYLRLTRTSMLESTAIVALLMFGSAVPLHLAQVSTYTIHLWYLMNLTADPEVVWLAAFPVLIVAGLGTMLVWHRFFSIGRDSSAAEEPASVDGRWSGPVWIGVLLVCSVGVPFALFVDSLQRPIASDGGGANRAILDALAGFWELSGAAVASSALVASCVGAAAIALGLSAAYATSIAGRVGLHVVAWCCGIWLFAAFIPGVLVGSAVGMAVAWLPLDRSEAAGHFSVGYAHLVRFGGLGVLSAYWIARSEPLSTHGLRRLDGAVGPRAWLATQTRATWVSMLGVGVATAALSLHEIEASVRLAPVGSSNLSQQLLGYLHYLRDEELSAALVNLLGVTMAVIALAGLVVMLAWRGERRKRNDTGIRGY